jgi:hypothetical protein
MKLRLSLVVALVASLIALPVAAAQAVNHTDKEVIRVYHQAVSPTKVSGSGIGTVRTFFIPMAVNGQAADDQYLVGTLTTLTNAMANGLELRGSDLTFVFGSEEDQIVLGGISYYPTDGATLAPGATTVRPVLGGSGKYEGARGQATSLNLGADGWIHTFRISVD